MQKIDNYNFKGKKVIVRVDFNVPLNKETGEVSDDTRIRGALPTIKKIIEDGGAAILMSHMGRPKKNPDPNFSLKQIISAIEKNLGKTIKFAEDCQSADAQVKALAYGEVLLLENLRFYAEEEGSTAVIADFFDESHKMFGFLIDKELAAMDKVLGSSRNGFTAIMGGAKVSDKIMIIENLLNRVENLIIGGGMTYTFIKALGGKIGNSLCEEDKLDVAKEILDKAKAKGVNVYLPVDAVNADKFDANANTNISKTNETPDGWMGLDIADESIKKFEEIITNSKTVLWNGPMGVFEMDKFAKGTSANLSISSADLPFRVRYSVTLVTGCSS